MILSQTNREMEYRKFAGQLLHATGELHHDLIRLSTFEHNKNKFDSMADDYNESLKRCAAANAENLLNVVYHLFEFLEETTNYDKSKQAFDAMMQNIITDVQTQYP